MTDFAQQQRLLNAVEYVESRQMQDLVDAKWERVLAAHPEIDADVFRPFAQQALEVGDPNFEVAYGRYTEVLNNAERVVDAQEWQPEYTEAEYPELHKPAPARTMDDAAAELMFDLRAARSR